MTNYDSQDKRFNCPSCGAENFVYVSFCIACGSLLDEHEPATGNEPSSKSPPRGELASENQRRLGLFRSRWEFYVGILVFLSVTGYVLNDWQQTNARSEAYRSGIAAAASRDWDSAVADFMRAENYLSSEEREVEARKKVAERDRLYMEGLTTASRRDWRSSVETLQRLQAVQPAYRDSASLLAQAKTNLLNEGLANIVFLVDDGLAPGLYVRDGQGLSTLLPGSDRRSVVRAISPDGTAIVYDRPAADADYLVPPSTGNITLLGPFGQGIPDRIPVLARLDSVVTTLSIPQLDMNGTGIFTEKGMWWYSSQPGNGFFGFEVSYWSQYLPGGAGVVRVSDLAGGKRVMAVDPTRSLVVIAQARGNARDSERETDLYLADAAGQNRQLLYIARGEVYQASFSADGRWLLYMTQQNGLPKITRTASVLRLDTTALANGAQPVLADGQEPRILRSLSWSGLQMDTRLSAAFVPSRDGNAKVIVNHVEYGTEHLLIHDLDADTIDVLWRERSDGAYRRDVSAFSHDGKFLVSRRQQSDGAIIYVAGLKLHSGSLNSAPFPVSNSQIVITQFAPLDDYVIVSIQNEEGINRGHTQKIFSLRNGEARSRVDAHLIAEADWPYDTNIPTIAMPPNGSMLAYVNAQRELRAVFYDGTGDILVNDGVKAVWSLKGQRNLSWRR